MDSLAGGRIITDAEEVDRLGCRAGDWVSNRDIEKAFPALTFRPEEWRMVDRLNDVEMIPVRLLRVPGAQHDPAEVEPLCEGGCGYEKSQCKCETLAYFKRLRAVMDNVPVPPSSAEMGRAVASLFETKRLMDGEDAIMSAVRAVARGG